MASNKAASAKAHRQRDGDVEEVVVEDTPPTAPLLGNGGAPRSEKPRSFFARAFQTFVQDLEDEGPGAWDNVDAPAGESATADGDKEGRALTHMDDSANDSETELIEFGDLNVERELGLLGEDDDDDDDDGLPSSVARWQRSAKDAEQRPVADLTALLRAHVRQRAREQEQVLIENLGVFARLAREPGNEAELRRLGELARRPLDWWGVEDAHCPVPLMGNVMTPYVTRLAKRCYAVYVDILQGACAFYLTALLPERGAAPASSGGAAPHDQSTWPAVAAQLDALMTAVRLGRGNLNPRRPFPRMLLVSRTSECYKQLAHAYDGAEHARSCLSALETSVPYALVVALCSLAAWPIETVARHREARGIFAAEEPVDATVPETSMTTMSSLMSDTGLGGAPAQAEVAIAVGGGSSDATCIVDTDSWVALPEALWPLMKE